MEASENKFYEVTNSQSIAELLEILGTDCRITSKKIEIGSAHTTPDIFPETYTSGAISAELSLRRHRVFPGGEGWRIKHNRSRFYIITVDNSSDDYDEWRFVVKKYCTAGLIDADMTQEWIEIKPSTIPGAGRGVFAKRDLAANTILGYYRGEVVDERRRKDSSDKVMTLYKRPPWWPSGVKFYRGISLDGATGGNWLALINDYRGTGQPKNADFGQDGMFYTVIPIKKGQELFIDYGSGYWIGRAPFSKEALRQGHAQEDGVKSP